MPNQEDEKDKYVFDFDMTFCKSDFEEIEIENLVLGENKKVKVDLPVTGLFTIKGKIHGSSFESILYKFISTRQTNHKKFFRILWIMVKLVVHKIKQARKPITNDFYYSVLAGNIKKFAELMTNDELNKVLIELEKEAFERRV